MEIKDVISPDPYTNDIGGGFVQPPPRVDFDSDDQQEEFKDNIDPYAHHSKDDFASYRQAPLAPLTGANFDQSSLTPKGRTNIDPYSNRRPEGMRGSGTDQPFTFNLQPIEPMSQSD